MDKSYWELFFGESQEYLSQINSCLVKLEKDATNQDALHEVFRLMHTLKGMAATMGFDTLSEFAHKIEDVFDELRSGRKEVTPQAMDTIFSSIDAFGILLDELRGEKTSSTVDVNRYLQELEHMISQQSTSLETAPRKETLPEKNKIEFSQKEAQRINQRKKEGFYVLQAAITVVENCPMKEARAYLILSQLKSMGEIVKTFPELEKLKAGKFERAFQVILITRDTKDVIHKEVSRILEIEAITVDELDEVVVTAQMPSKSAEAPSYIKKIQSMRITVERLDKIMNFMGELSIAKSRLVQLLRTRDTQDLEETVFIIDRLVSSLQDEILQTRLLPISYILDTFPRVVRDLVRKSNKDVELEIIGSEIELDRVVLDEIGDPLMHIVRNAIDHGMEDKETRKNAGKSPKGKVVIRVSREKGHVVVGVSDDGRGVDFAKIARKAVEKGIVNDVEAASLDEKQILDIMTAPGFSTSATVTEVSGRGVGLDVVRAKLDALGGRLDFESELGKGTKFTLTLPLTLAIIKAMLVIVGKEIFAIPLMSIRESVKVTPEEIKTIEGKEVIKVRDEIIPIIRLDKELGITYHREENGRLSIVLVEGRIKSLGLIVDRIMGEQDIVVKPLGSMVRKIKGIAGATILGDGRVALILDVVNLH